MVTLQGFEGLGGAFEKKDEEKSPSFEFSKNFDSKSPDEKANEIVAFLKTTEGELDEESWKLIQGVVKTIVKSSPKDYSPLALFPSTKVDSAKILTPEIVENVVVTTLRLLKKEAEIEKTFGSKYAQKKGKRSGSIQKSIPNKKEDASSQSTARVKAPTPKREAVKMKEYNFIDPSYYENIDQITSTIFNKETTLKRTTKNEGKRNKLQNEIAELKKLEKEFNNKTSTPIEITPVTETQEDLTFPMFTIFNRKDGAPIKLVGIETRTKKGIFKVKDERIVLSKEELLEKIKAGEWIEQAEETKTPKGEERYFSIGQKFKSKDGKVITLVDFNTKTNKGYFDLPVIGSPTKEEFLKLVDSGEYTPIETLEQIIDFKKDETVTSKKEGELAFVGFTPTDGKYLFKKEDKSVIEYNAAEIITLMGSGEWENRITPGSLPKKEIPPGNEKEVEQIEKAREEAISNQFHVTKEEAAGIFTSIPTIKKRFDVGANIAITYLKWYEKINKEYDTRLEALKAKDGDEKSEPNQSSNPDEDLNKKEEARIALEKQIEEIRARILQNNEIKKRAEEQKRKILAENEAIDRELAELAKMDKEEAKEGEKIKSMKIENGKLVLKFK